MIYELREYVAHEHTARALHDRFQKATLPLFEKHGLDVVGFWVDQDQPTHLLYLLRFPDEETKTDAWANFQADPDWLAAKSESEREGPIVASMSSRALTPVDYWPGG